MKRWNLQSNKRQQVYPKVAKTESNAVPVTTQPRKPKLPLDILVCTPDATSALTQKCLKSLRETTAHIEYTLYIEDNHGVQPFNHAESMNEALDRTTGYLVTCDDDVTFTPGWLDSALDIVEADKDVGVVAFHLYDAPGKIWASSMWCEGAGDFHHCRTQFTEPRMIPSQCSACLLIAPTELRMDTRYKKCRFEHDFQLRVWESGKKVIVSPAIVYHVRGGQFNRLVRKPERDKDYDNDERIYLEEWLNTGREKTICKKIEGMVLKLENKVFKRPEKERLAVMTIATNDYWKQTVPLMERYARKIGADFWLIDEKWMSDEKSPILLKFKINALFAMGYTRVLYLDADIIVKPDAPNIFDYVEPGTLGVFDESSIMETTIPRKKTWENMVAFWNKNWGKKDVPYPGYFFNAGMMVVEPSCNPFVPREDGIYCEQNNITWDQDYINVVAAGMPKTFLDWKWNRMGIEQAHKYFGNRDMLKDSYFAHYCGFAGKQKPLIPKELARITPPAVERKQGYRMQGLYDLCRFIGSVQNMVEVGSAHGESAWIFTDMWPNVKVTCIDPWDSDRYGKKAKADFDTRHGWNPNVKSIVGRSVEVLSQIPDASLDFVYLDAMHDYDNVKKDIEAWLPKIKKGGWIGGHDFVSRARKELPEFPGVVQAVNEKFGGPDMLFADGSWIVQI